MKTSHRVEKGIKTVLIGGKSMPNKVRESEIVFTVAKNKRAISGVNDDWDVTTEVYGGYGIADLLFYSANKAEFQSRIKRELKTPILAQNTIKTILAIKEAEEPVSVSYLTRQLGIKAEAIESRIISFLKSEGYIEQQGDKYKLLYEFDNALFGSIGIEAKISNWKRGLYQAYRYKWFCQKSYLAIYHKFTNQPFKNLALFQKLNVGLLSVGDSTVESIFDPIEECPKSPDMVILSSEQVFSDYLKTLVTKQE